MSSKELIMKEAGSSRNSIKTRLTKRHHLKNSSSRLWREDNFGSRATTTNQGQRKKKKTIGNVNGNSPPLSSSECGLEEVELSQSDVERGGNKIDSPMSKGNGREMRKQNSSSQNDTVTDDIDCLMDTTEIIPLSQRRLERAKSRSTINSPLNNDGFGTIAGRDENNNLNCKRAVQQPCTNNGEESADNCAPIEIGFAHNAMKAEIAELKRDKRAYSSALVTLRERLEQMIKDLHIKTQQIEALEDALARKKGDRGGNKALPWSLESLSRCGIERYQGICLSAGKHGSKLAKLMVTETFIDEKNRGYQKQDWSPSASKVSNEMATKLKIYVKLPDGVLAIPVCNMIGALKLEFFTPRFNGSVGFLKESFKNVLEGPVGSYLSEPERNECLARVSSHRPTIRKFRAIISDAVGNRKKAARNTYLKSLGYRYASLPESKKDTDVVKDLRDKEKEAILKRCVKRRDENDTTFWRTSEWGSLCFSSLSVEVGNEMDEAEKELEQRGEVDNLFMNEAARRAFLLIRGYTGSSSIDDEFSSDTSMLYLARADASMTTMLKFIAVKGKGGARNENFVESFRSLLPKALAVVIKDIWSDLEVSSPHELKLHIGNSHEDIMDPYGNNVRDWTVVQKNPDDNHLYLLASPKYFREKVCSWYGIVKDGHIARYDMSMKEFVMISSSLSSHEVEESDIEDGTAQVEQV